MDELAHRAGRLLREHAFSITAVALGLGLLTAAAYRLAAPVGLPQPLTDARTFAVAAAPPASLAARASATPAPSAPTRNWKLAIMGAATPIIAREARHRVEPEHRRNRLSERAVLPQRLKPAKVTRRAIMPEVLRASPRLRAPPLRRPMVDASSSRLRKPPAGTPRFAPLRSLPARRVVQRNARRSFGGAIPVARIVALALPRHRDGGRRPRSPRGVAVFEPPLNYNAQPALLTTRAEPLQATTALTVTVRPSRRRR
ncbi:MAG: hypothetical protein GIX03_09650 [Candidatus Eremiobacteraeota bacterium]|nr:hypothetical protein [Candidatus Eremiobacteraeota bacterium]MBC5803234.1 hypothetical protein [Candidatus Eremiobacteraeota bacterium]MBC5823042.1 hypothetical protein [Candidatus Eremiobacteraeota bacterium]